MKRRWQIGFLPQRESAARRDGGAHRFLAPIILALRAAASSSKASRHFEQQIRQRRPCSAGGCLRADGEIAARLRPLLSRTRLDDDDADEGELAPRPRRAVDGGHDQAAVDMQAAGRGLDRRSFWARAKPQDIAVLAAIRSRRCPASAASFACRADAGPRHAWGSRRAASAIDRAPQLALARDGPKCGQRIVGRHEVDAEAGQVVMDGAHGLLVAGDGLGREHDQVALIERDLRMLVLGDAAMAARGSPWLPVQSSMILSGGR